MITFPVYSSAWTRRITLFLLLLCGLLPLGAEAISERQRDAIRQRIMPVGKVCLQGDPCASAVFTPPVFSGPRSGEQAYQVGCISCHGDGIAGAPRSGVTADWELRIAKGLETLYANAINGYGTMPARGVCLDCSDAEVQAAVDYMLEQVR